MSLPHIFTVCSPRHDVLAGAITESDFAADLAQVIRGTAPEEYRDAGRFFENTYPTRGLRNLLANVSRRLTGAGGEVAAIFRLDTQFGGGKTHGLIALVHAARGMQGVANVTEFIDRALLPNGAVRVAAFDGENADPINGRTMGDGIRAFTPWGELAYALAGKAGYERVRASDERRVAPGADTLRELFGGEPTLILLDELSVYLRKVKSLTGARDQLSAFLTSLFKAVEGTPTAALVYTLAIGKDSRASDAYSDENEFIAERMAEAESISARKATLLNPTEDDETAHVLRRRLFARMDEAQAAAVIEAYRALWKQQETALSPQATHPETIEAFRASYPLHPEVLETLTEKAATLSNFQRVRGMLRLLARTINRLWQTKPADAYAIHLHHVDLGYEPVRQEIITRLGLGQYAPTLKRDVAGEGGSTSLAQEIDAEHYKGLPPYATYVARTIFLHTLAFNDLAWVEGGDEPRTVREALFDPNRLYTLRSRLSAAYKGLHALLMRDGGLDFLSGQPITFTTFSDERIDIHHIFPKKWCEDHGIPRTRYDCIVNKTALSARTNRIIGKKAPSVYLGQIQREAGMSQADMDNVLRTHLIDPPLLRADNFEAFFSARATVLLDRIASAMGKPVAAGAYSEVVGEAADQEDEIEPSSEAELDAAAA